MGDPSRHRCIVCFIVANDTQLQQGATGLQGYQAALSISWLASAGLVRAAAFYLGIALTLLSAASVSAADPSGQSPLHAPTTAPIANDWAGLYVGGYVGYATGTSGWSAAQAASAAPGLSGSLDFYNPLDGFKGSGSFFGGLQAGYNYMFPSRFLVGVETDGLFPNSIAGSQTISPASTGQASYGETVVDSGTARGRIGYAFDRWLIYGTGGFAWTYDQLTRNQFVGPPAGASATAGTAESAFMWRLGWAAGAGVEVPFAPNWTARLEYLFTGFGHNGVTFPAADQRFDSDLAMNQVRLGVNYKLGGEGTIPGGAQVVPASLPADNWSIHGQATFVSQYALPFHAPYGGQNSLDSNTGRETWDVTLYAGLRPWEGAELWINPETEQGFGLSNTLGIAGFPNGEAYKVGASYPYTRLQRIFVRQTIGLGGETEKVKPDLNQFGGSQSADRLVLTLGRFAVWDIFDTNKYAHENRSDFLNWSIIDTGTFDYAADPWGYTYGGAVEWYQGRWTARAGLFDLSIVPNTIELDPQFEQFQWIGEIERRHELLGQPGKLAVTGFLTRGRMGRYDDALKLAALTGDAPDTALVRHYAGRPGVGLNLEQQIMPNVGVFGRLGWADGDIEPYEFTDIDRTAAAGVSLAGKAWGRPDDTFGLAGVVNEISAAHIAYLNAGGLGILVGDGQLPHPGPEQIIETYYTFPIGSWQATVDYQFIANPAYNRDRGPVSVIGLRLHAQF
jgi:high affinity Mn2+ porin